MVKLEIVGRTLRFGQVSIIGKVGKSTLTGSQADMDAKVSQQWGNDELVINEYEVSMKLEGMQQMERSSEKQRVLRVVSLWLGKTLVLCGVQGTSRRRKLQVESKGGWQLELSHYKL